VIIAPLWVLLIIFAIVGILKAIDAHQNRKR
jgi:hypothetical protein